MVSAELARIVIINLFYPESRRRIGTDRDRHSRRSAEEKGVGRSERGEEEGGREEGRGRGEEEGERKMTRLYPTPRCLYHNDFELRRRVADA